jgi:hypothetical protein
MEHVEPISLQVTDTHCRLVHAHVYSVPMSVEQQLQQNKDIVRLVGVGVLEEDYSSDWYSLPPTFSIPKKKVKMRFITDFKKLNLLLKRRISPISYSKYCGC